jgi:hypothetical protein
MRKGLQRRDSFNAMCKYFTVSLILVACDHGGCGILD